VIFVILVTGITCFDLQYLSFLFW